MQRPPVAPDMENGMNFAALAFCGGPPLIFFLVAYYSKSRGVFQWMVTLVFLYFCLVGTAVSNAMLRAVGRQAHESGQSSEAFIAGMSALDDGLAEIRLALLVMGAFMWLLAMCATYRFKDLKASAGTLVQPGDQDALN